MTQAIGPDSGETRSVTALMSLAQAGDRDAFGELQRIGEERGIKYTEKWSAHLVLYRLKDRASPTNLLARASVEETLAATIHDLSDPRDGAIERLVIARAAICLIDADQSELEYLGALQQVEAPWGAEVYDRRRDRAQRRLLATLKTLAGIRQMNRPAAVQVTQLAVGDGNTNIIKV